MKHICFYLEGYCFNQVSMIYSSAGQEFSETVKNRAFTLCRLASGQFKRAGFYKTRFQNGQVPARTGSGTTRFQKGQVSERTGSGKDRVRKGQGPEKTGSGKDEIQTGQVTCYEVTFVKR